MYPTPIDRLNPAAAVSLSDRIVIQQGVLNGGATLRATASQLLNQSTNVKNYYASGSSQSTTGTISGGSKTLTLAAPLDFATNQGIIVSHAGAAFTLTAPSGLTVTPHGTTGSTTYAYQIAAVDSAGGYGIAIAAVTITNGNAALGLPDYNALAWTNGTGTKVAIWRSKNGGAYTFVALATGTSFNDATPDGSTAAPFWLPATPPVAAAADWLVTSIAGGGGTASLTLATAATTTATAQPVWHEDTAAINAAIVAATPNQVYLPAGNYVVDQILLAHLSRVTIRGAGKASTTLYSYTENDTVWFDGNGAGQQNAISDLKIDTVTPGSKSAGWAIRLTEQYNPVVRGVDIRGFDLVLIESGTGNALIEDGVYTPYGDYGIRMVGTLALPIEQMTLRSISQTGGPNLATKFIHVDSYVSSVVGWDIGALGGGYGLVVDDTAATGTSFPTWIWFINLQTDHTYGDGVMLNGGAWGWFTDGWYGSSMTGNGFNCGAGFKRCAIDGFYANGNALNGIRGAGEYCQILNGESSANSVGNPSTYYQVYIPGGVTHITVQGVLAGNVASDGGDSATAAGCIGIDTGAGDYLLIKDNDLTLGGAAITNRATGKHNVIRDNLGYNPVGGSSVTPGASIWTYTAGPTPETHYLYNGNVSSITVSAVNLPGGNPLPITTLQLEPNESYSVAYTTTAPTVERVIH